jgi:hypothetical protein
MKIEHKKVSELIPYVNNARTHSEQQITQIAASIKEFGFSNPILTDGKNGVIAGHGRLMAAQKLGLDTVPVIELSHLTDAQKKAYILADNRLAELSGWDEELLKIELESLKDMDFDVDLTGFDFELQGDIEEQNQTLDDEKYTTKTDVFTYEPTGDKPELDVLFDDSKAKELISEIEKSDLSEHEKQFLKLAAYRHVVFDFQQIANYYAHSEQAMQQIMENSALVIIDYEDAISGGFVQLTKELQALVAEND